LQKNEGSSESADTVLEIRHLIRRESIRWKDDIKGKSWWIKRECR
jgi:hypothetical protein